MKIISELTNKEYSTVEECLKDEEYYKAKEEEKRKAEKLRLEEKEADKAYLDKLRTAANDAFSEYQEAVTKYNNAVTEYNKKYRLYNDSLDRLSNY